MKVKYCSGKGTIHYTRDAAVYEGEFLNSQPHGAGKMTYKDGRVCEGEWRNGKMDKGIGKRPDGSVWYEAEYRDGKATMKFGNGDKTYEGDFEIINDKIDGVGKMIDKDGRVREGIWKDGEITYEGELDKNGKPHGRGKKMYPWGNYDGSWQHGKYYGEGTLKYTYGKYEGQFKDDKKHGKGTYTRSDGSVEYDGEWKDSMRHGRGTYNDKNGDVYTGDWLANRMQGKGVMTYANGDVYNGQWHSDKKHGRGVMTYANQDIYGGEWKDGHKDGGIMKYHNGDMYEGQFSKGKMHGKGTYTYAAGDISKSIGEWKDGKKCGEFENIRFSEKVYYDNDELKVDSNVKREAPFDEDTDTEDAPPTKRHNVCVSPPQPKV